MNTNVSVHRSDHAALDYNTDDHPWHRWDEAEMRYCAREGGLKPWEWGKPTGVSVSQCISWFQTQLILTPCQIRYPRPPHLSSKHP